MKKITFIFLFISIISFSQEMDSIKYKLRSFDLLKSNKERKNKIRNSINNFILNNKSISVDTLIMNYGLLIDKKGLIFITYNKINDNQAHDSFNKLFTKKYRIKPFKDPQNNSRFNYNIKSNNKYIKQFSMYNLCTTCEVVAHEKVPIYPGCEGDNESLKKCMVKNISKHITRKFNIDLANNIGLPPGAHKISVQFCIGKTGLIKDVKADAPHPIMKEEATRVIRLLPQMIAGKQKGKEVQVIYNLPIIFNVVETKSQKKLRKRAEKAANKRKKLEEKRTKY